jgi:hypothetical protein
MEIPVDMQSQTWNYINSSETGLVQPGRQTLLALANMLDIRLRKHNFLLLAGEYAIAKLS